jgi:hypothetical protein
MLTRGLVVSYPTLPKFEKLLGGHRLRVENYGNDLMVDNNSATSTKTTITRLDKLALIPNRFQQPHHHEGGHTSRNLKPLQCFFAIGNNMFKNQSRTPNKILLIQPSSMKIPIITLGGKNSKMALTNIRKKING